MINWIKDKTEDLRERLAWWIFPEFNIYIEVAKIMGSTQENDRVVKVLADSDFRYKDGAIKLVENTYKVIDVKEFFDNDLI